MSIIRELASFLGANGIGTLGTDIFVGEMPPNPANAIMLMPAVSAPPDMYLDTMYLNVEVWCRDRSTKTGGDRLDAVFSLLQRYHHLDLGDYYIYFINSIGNVEDLDRDSEGRKLQRITFRLVYRDTRTVS